MVSNSWLTDRCNILPYKTLEEWHGNRSLGLGGSDMAAIFGLAEPYRSAYSLWTEKTGELTPEEAGEAAYWGTKLEDLVAQEYAERTGAALMEWKVTLQMKDRPFALANVDRFIVEPSEDFPAGKSTLWGTEEETPELPPTNEILGIYEGKTAGKGTEGKWDDEAIPQGYQLQGQWYLLVTGLWWCRYGCLLTGQTFITREMTADPDTQSDMLEVAEWFWDLVEKRTPPPVDDSEATERALKAQYTDVSVGSRVEGGKELRGLLEDLREAKEETKTWEAKKRGVSNKIKAILEDNEAGTIDGKIAVTLKSIASSGLDQEKLEKEYPDVFQACRTSGSYRRLMPVKGAI